MCLTEDLVRRHDDDNDESQKAIAPVATLWARYRTDVIAVGNITAAVSLMLQLARWYALVTVVRQYHLYNNQ